MADAASIISDCEDVADDEDMLPNMIPALPLKPVFHESRHLEAIKGMTWTEQSWRMKERAKTTSVALVLCLNVGVDPPDVIKTQPCAKLEAWIDPLSMAPQKALEAIAGKLQKQYEQLQPRARYKQSLDPTVDEVKKLCISLRRNAHSNGKPERILFHYNGHGVPKPTVNGELWVFNKSYTQYIPLSLYDLQQWMGTPAIYVYDCSNAGQIVESFNQFSLQREREEDLNIQQQQTRMEGVEAAAAASEFPTALERISEINHNGIHNDSNSDNSQSSQDPNRKLLQSPLPSEFKRCIQLAACGKDELLPMNPDLPADLFTSCLTTPIKIALQWFIKHNSGRLLPGVTAESLERIPGQLSDRRTMLGELNWIFTAITDTIAWNVLPKKLFQELFRQDLLVASLFRNFLLADRIMRSYNCTPVSSPELPATCHHPMWQAWDLAVDSCLTQLPRLLNDPTAIYDHSNFFSEQLTAFQVWLNLGNHEISPPEQLPIVLQVLLSQVHRLRALDLLSRFLDLGPWAVSLGLSLGIFPYVLKLLQSSARELRPLLVFIWAKILAVEGSCQTDLVKDNGHKYFINLLSDTHIPSDFKGMAAFVLAMIVRNYSVGQEAAFQGNLIATCLEQLSDPYPLLRKWCCICLGLVWEKFDNAYWRGVRDLAHEKLLELLQNEPEAEVRAAAVFALGTFIHSASERTDQPNAIDLQVGIGLLGSKVDVSLDGSPLVRKELLVALQWLVMLFENHFTTLQSQWDQEEKLMNGSPQGLMDPMMYGTPPFHGALRKISSRDRLSRNSCQNMSSNYVYSTPGSQPVNSSQEFLSPASGMKRISSVSSLTGQVRSEYKTIWRAIHLLSSDPHPEAAKMADAIIDEIRSRVQVTNNNNTDGVNSHSGSPCNGNKLDFSGDGLSSQKLMSNLVQSSCSSQSTPHRHYTVSEGPATSTNTSTPTGIVCRRKTTSNNNVNLSSNNILVQDSQDNESTTSSTTRGNCIVFTHFVSWCIKQFVSKSCRLDAWDPESSDHQKKEMAFGHQIRVSEMAKDELSRVDSTRIEEQMFLHKYQKTPRFMQIHPFEPYLFIAERDSFTILSWEGLKPQEKAASSPSFPPGIIIAQSKNRINHSSSTAATASSSINASSSSIGQSSFPVVSSTITGMELLNVNNMSTLLSLAADDGSVRIWSIDSHLCETDTRTNRIKPKLISAFYVFKDSNSQDRSLINAFASSRDTSASVTPFKTVICWEQESSCFIAGSNTNRHIKIWDSNQEKVVRVIRTDSDAGVNTISSDGHNVICAGFMDGTVRCIDRREDPSSDKPFVRIFREHKSPIVNAHLFSQDISHLSVLSASADGEVKFWDKRLSSSIKTMSLGQDLSTMTVHPETDVFACGYSSPGPNSINIYSLDGIPGSSIRSYDGFMGQRIGPISCLAFHPLRAQLAAGTTDNFISIYSARQH